MATTLKECGPIIGDISTKLLDYHHLREMSALIRLIEPKLVDHCGTHLATILLEDDGLYENCGPSNYVSPDCISDEIRSIDICEWIRSYKIPNCYIKSQSFDARQFLYKLMTRFTHAGLKTFEKIIYKALISDVLVKSQNTSGGTSVSKSLVDDIGTSSIIDASSTGLTMAKLYDAVNALSSKYHGSLRPILLVPSSGWLDLQKDIFDKGANSCCAIKDGINLNLVGAIGGITVVKSIIGDNLFRDVGGKLRAFLFQPEAIDVIFSNRSTLTEACCDSDIVIRPGMSNGYISGIIKTNPGIQFGGYLVQLEMNAGGARIDPNGIVAIDLAKK